MTYAVQSAKKMRSLILDLLSYSRLTGSDHVKRCDVQSVLNQSLRNLNSLIKEKDAEITINPMPVIWGDETQLVQVFQNLIGNALKFVHQNKPKIQVKAERRSKEWVFSVNDNGIGIEEQFFDKIFIVFQQLEKSGPFDGSGIGLAIVKKIVERHGGTVWVESEIGRGSTFYFSIPDIENKSLLS